MDEIEISATQFFLNEETSKHVVQVLRMLVGEQLNLTDGKGNLFTAAILDNNRKKCSLKIISCTRQAATAKRNSVAISLVKNNTRFEWFVEKAVEIGINEIIPLLCTRTEKQYFKSDRMKNIVISAMLQSQQCWLPILREPTKFTDVLSSTSQQKFIAHCEDDFKTPLQDKLAENFTETLILIGPEGDFTKDEITAALHNKFLPVTLGNTRLRTETAGIVAATLLCI